MNKIYQNFSAREDQIDAKTRSKIVKLVGEKPLLKCKLDGVDYDVLWDTGSMISLVDLEWVNYNFPDKKILSVEEVLGDEKLEVRAEGIILLDFSARGDVSVFTTSCLERRTSLILDH